MKSPRPRKKVSLTPPYHSARTGAWYRPAGITARNRVAAVAAAAVSLVAVGVFAVIMVRATTVAPLVPLREAAASTETTVPAASETNAPAPEVAATSAKDMRPMHLAADGTPPPTAAAPTSRVADAFQGLPTSQDSTSGAASKSADAAAAETDKQAVAQDKAVAGDVNAFAGSDKPDGTNSSAAVLQHLARAVPVPTSPTSVREAKVVRSVNLRAEPKSGSKVIGVVPAGTAINVPASCSHWCEVEYKGQRGYLYKSFIKWPAKQGEGKAGRS